LTRPRRRSWHGSMPRSIGPLIFISGGLLLIGGGIAAAVSIGRDPAGALPPEPALPPALPPPGPPSSARPSAGPATPAPPAGAPPRPAPAPPASPSPAEVRKWAGSLSPPAPPAAGPSSPAPPSQAKALPRALRNGDRGADVEGLQRILSELGYTVTVDGRFGPQTATAVKALQKAQGLSQDGIAGPATWTALSTAYAAKLKAAGAIPLGPATA